MRCKRCKQEMGVGEASSEYCDGFCINCYGKCDCCTEGSNTGFSYIACSCSCHGEQDNPKEVIESLSEVKLSSSSQG